MNGRLSREGKEINEILSDTEYFFLKRFSKCFSKLEISELQKNSSPFRSLRVIPVSRIMTNEIKYDLRYYFVSSNRKKKSKVKMPIS